MFCIFSAARILTNVTRSLVEGDDFTVEFADCPADPGHRHNPLTESLGSKHWTWRLTCGVCLEFFRDPIILPCGHSFCRRCILRIIDHEWMARLSVEGEILKFRCPECRHGIKVNTSRNRFTANITARSVLTEWFNHFNYRQLIDRAVQTDSTSHRTKSTQTSQNKDTQVIFTMNKTQETNDLQRHIAEIRNTTKIKAVSCNPRQKGEITAPVICIPVLRASCPQVTTARMRDPSNQTDQLPTSSDKTCDYWGLYSLKKESPNPQSVWVSPESDISKFGWFFNHTLFAFCVTMLCTDNKIDI